jgi:Fur family peroxide stress response transcriptional regulator
MNYSKQKQLIYDIVKSTDTHPTADRIYTKARKKMPNIGIATVYRNLNTLVEEKAIICIKTVGKADRYDGRVDDHLHFECVHCGEIFDLMPSSIEEGEEAIENLCRVYGISRESINTGSTVLRGVCDKCRAESAE